MTNNFRNYVNIDELIERTPLDLILSHYGLPLTQPGASEYRLKCVFAESCSDSKYGNLSVKLDAAKRIYCHTCHTKGNLLTLLHGLEYHRPPEGGHLRGQEFKAATAKLKEINGLVDSPPSASNSTQHGSQAAQAKQTEQITSASNSKAAPLSSDENPNTEGNSKTVVSTGNSSSASPAPLVNVPLSRHEKEAARELESLYQELIVDVERMSPEAAAFVRKRPWLTPELMQKWGCGWIPGNGRSLFRKNYFVYTHRNVRGEVISYSGRDLSFEKKWDQWIKGGKPEGKKPSKHRYVAGYHRGSELFGAIASRLEQPEIQESLESIGLVVVEGMNDVIRLDSLGVCAVGLCSNRATEIQVALVTKFARQVSDSRVLLFPDRDAEGIAGFKDLLWALTQQGLQVRVAPPDIAGGDGSQPEDIVAEAVIRLKE